MIKNRRYYQIIRGTGLFRLWSRQYRTLAEAMHAFGTDGVWNKRHSRIYLVTAKTIHIRKSRHPISVIPGAEELADTDLVDRGEKHLPEESYSLGYDTGGTSFQYKTLKSAMLAFAGDASRNLSIVRHTRTRVG